MKYILASIIVLFTVILLTLLVVNHQPIISFNYLLAKGELSLWALLGLFFIAGIVLSALIFLPIYLRLHWRLHQANKRLSSSQQQSELPA